MAKKIGWWGLRAALIFFLFAVAQGLAFGAEKTVKIALLTDLSGTLAIAGKEGQQGFEIAVEEWNKKGGLLGKHIELIIEDDESKPAVALRKGEKLVLDKGIKFIVGTPNSGVALALAAKAPEWKIVYSTMGAKNPAVTGEKWNRNTFRRNRNDDQDMMIMSAWLDDHPKFKNWYCIGADYVWGRGNVAAFKKIAEAKNRKIMGEVFPELGTKDYGAQIVQIMEKKPQAVWAALSGSWAIDFIRQASSFGLMKTSEVVGVLLLQDTVVSASGKAALGLYGHVNYQLTIDTPENKAFVKAFQAKFGRVPTAFNAEGYITALMMLNGIKKAQTEDVNKVIAAMEGMEFVTPLGKELVREADHQVIQPNYMGRVVSSDKEPGVKVEITGIYDRDKGAVPVENTGLPPARLKALKK